MQVKESYNKCVAELVAVYTPSESNKLTEILFEDLLHIDRKKIRFSDDELNSTQSSTLQQAIERLKKHEPVQYITGIAHFMDFILKVDSNVLIPRPETEELVEWVVNDVKQTGINVIDVGTGSGCIAIALKKIKPDWNITAIDISEGAITTAVENARVLRQDIHFIHADVNDALPSENKFDLIISNPPYISYSEKDSLDKNVISYEPATALFEPSEFYFYESIISFAKKYLSDKGAIFVEINQDKALKLRDLFMEYFEIVELKKDISSNYRFLKATQLKNIF